jgi:hypothetical protein
MHRIAILSGISAIAVMAAGAPHSHAQQPCNPAIDGTYCAQAGIGSPGGPPSAARRAVLDLSLGQGLSGNFYDKPATLGAITFGSDGSRCIGLVRRLSCRGGN